MKLLIETISLQLGQQAHLELRPDLLAPLHLSEPYASKTLGGANSREANGLAAIFSRISTPETPVVHQDLLEKIKPLLRRFCSAKPLINQILEQPQSLIDVLRNSSMPVLEALQGLGLSPQWTSLITVVTGRDECLSELKRRECINFLRDLSWLEELKTSMQEAQILFTLGFQLLTVTKTDTDASLQELADFCEEYPLTLPPLGLNQFITTYLRQLSKSVVRATNTEFIRLLSQLLKNLKSAEQQTVISHLSAFDLSNLLKLGMEDLFWCEPKSQQAYRDILLILHSHAGFPLRSRIEEALNKLAEAIAHNEVKQDNSHNEPANLVQDFKKRPIAYELEKLQTHHPYGVPLKKDLRALALYHSYGLDKLADAACLSSLIRHLDSKDIFSLWLKIPDPNQGLVFFHALFLHDKCRDRLLLGNYGSHFARFLKQQSPAVVLRTYLTSFHEQPWFLDGLTLFARFGQEFGQELLLIETLAGVYEDELAGESWNTLLFTLINTAKGVSVLLDKFGQDDQTLAIQQLKFNLLAKLCTYFNKQHLVFLLKTLNQTSSWDNNPYYRFALIFLHSQHQRLFGATSLWGDEELAVLALFIERHLSENNLWDKHSSLGFKLLGFLLFYCAATGYTKLFFNSEGQFNRLITYSIPRHLLIRLADDFTKASSAAQKSYLCTLFTVPDEAGARGATKLLPPIPVLGVYLLYYQGPSAALEQLLGHYFITYADKPTLIYPLAALLSDFAERSIAAVIFDSLQKFIFNNPHYLNAALFAHLTRYYTQQKSGLGRVDMDGHIQLLSYWGKTGNYQLVNHSVGILLPLCQDESLKLRLNKVELESRLEAQLQGRINSPSLHHKLIKWCSRLWHYGVRWPATRSGLLVFADEADHYISPLYFAKPQIKHPQWQVEEKPVQVDRASAFSVLLSEVIRSALNKNEREFFGKIKQTLFAPANSAPHILPEVASKQLEAHV
ncbi:hypothetical protein [Legionella sp. km772]|uniref:hypothetical protein n=1 Tax=Legionella sp. km772 TaxID=2498111 RepID=UPI000F8F048D|nr:hypothetical protein [Legionella sp. km772]RUR13527.1 hypothetical protein ELY15_02165 [Legionella sp. km772]